MTGGGPVAGVEPAPRDGAGTTRPEPAASGTVTAPFAMLGDPDAAACEGDACLIP